MVIPSYINKIAVNAKMRGNCVYFDLKCACGCENFFVLQNKPTPENIEKQTKLEELFKKYKGSCYSDKNGNFVLTTFGFLGLFKRKYILPKSEFPKFIEIIKAKCVNCNEEFIIFDSSKYGYDGVIEPENNSHSQFEYELINTTDKASKISLKVCYDLTYGEFLENVGNNFSHEQYSNAFSDINIYEVSDAKCRKIYYLETA